MKKFIALALACAMTLSLVACGGSSETKTTTTETQDANVLSVCLASEPDTLDPALNSAVDGATMVIHLFQGLASWQAKEDGGYTIVPAAATDVLPAAAPSEENGGKVATEVIPNEPAK